jgi:hypothetical protein
MKIKNWLLKNTVTNPIQSSMSHFIWLNEANIFQMFDFCTDQIAVIEVSILMKKILLNIYIQ